MAPNEPCWTKALPHDNEKILLGSLCKAVLSCGILSWGRGGVGCGGGGRVIVLGVKTTGIFCRGRYCLFTSISSCRARPVCWVRPMAFFKMLKKRQLSAAIELPSVILSTPTLAPISGPMPGACTHVAYWHVAYWQNNRRKLNGRGNVTGQRKSENVGSQVWPSEMRDSPTAYCNYTKIWSHSALLAKQTH